MSNYRVKINLEQLKGAAVADLRGKTGAVKKCLVIPIEDAGLYVGQKGVYLSLTAWEARQPYYGETHSLKCDLPKDGKKRMSSRRYCLQGKYYRSKKKLYEALHQIECDI